MSSIQFIKIGRPAFAEYEPLVENYVTRISHFAACENKIIRENDPRHTLEKLRETLGIDPRRKSSKSNCLLICMDESGRHFSAPELASKMDHLLASNRPIKILIGGPYGIDREILEASDLKLSLSNSTLTSDMAWLFATEQVYRALTILKRVPYHHA
jgi:23S rRNA (pseudouridine1915-N3)-methyltransferase